MILRRGAHPKRTVIGMQNTRYYGDPWKVFVFVMSARCLFLLCQQHVVCISAIRIHFPRAYAYNGVIAVLWNSMTQI